ncbi:MAG: cupin domain-containing protein [Deltaproteobacteria bacterium]|nr:cupin domain-containing protein [Deltaproteobacteria bacterium]
MASAPPIPHGLLDSSPAASVLVPLAEYYQRRTLPPSGVDSDPVFESPRSQVMIRTAVKGTTIGAHYHSVCDEYVLVIAGRGEIFVNGEWHEVKAGDLHVCPRGVVHDTRALDEHLRYLSVFTPHPPPGNDINWLK